METCEMCGADLKGDSGCGMCLAVFEQLGVRPDGVRSFREWLEDVITTRIRSFLDEGELDATIDARIEKAVDKHERRFYHNRRPDH